MISGLPAGFKSSIYTFNGILMFGLLVNNMVHIRVTSDPKGGMGLGMLLDSTKEVGAGTACR